MVDFCDPWRWTIWSLASRDGQGNADINVRTGQVFVAQIGKQLRLFCEKDELKVAFNFITAAIVKK